MAYSRHTLVTFGGTLWQDSWQCGVRIMQARLGSDYVGDAPLNNPAGYMNAVAAALKAWFIKAGSTTAGSEFMPMRGDATLAWLKVNNIGPDGKYINRSASNIYTWTNPSGGGGGTPALPTVITAAISWTTDKTRGAGHRGRVYLPLAFPALNTDTLSALQMTQCLQTGKQLLDVLNNQVDPASGNVGDLAVDPVVASKIDGSLNPIRGIAVGSVIDVQRRRKEQIAETFSTLAYTP